MKKIVLFLILTVLLDVITCSKERPSKVNSQSAAAVVVQSSVQKDTTKANKNIKVTFIELGSVRCIPCKMMQPIMKDIKDQYAGQVKVVFYDVWTTEGQPYAKKYNIRVIPTQVFLDRDGKEYFRHEGYFPKEELVKVLEQKGVR